MSDFVYLGIDNQIDSKEVLALAEKCNIEITAVAWEVVLGSEKNVYALSLGSSYGVPNDCCIVTYDIYPLETKNMTDFDQFSVEHKKMREKHVGYHPNFEAMKTYYKNLKSFLNKYLKISDKISFIANIGHDEEISINAKKHVFFEDITIETFAFLQPNMLLTITKK